MDSTRGVPSTEVCTKAIPTTYQPSSTTEPALSDPLHQWYIWSLRRGGMLTKVIFGWTYVGQTTVPSPRRVSQMSLKDSCPKTETCYSALKSGLLRQAQLYITIYAATRPAHICWCPFNAGPMLALISPTLSQHQWQLAGIGMSLARVHVYIQMFPTLNSPSKLYLPCFVLLNTGRHDRAHRWGGLIQSVTVSPPVYNDHITRQNNGRSRQV